MTNDELYHYGVLGMKGGVHRSKVHAHKSEKFKKKALKAKQSGKTEKAKKMEFRAIKLLNLYGVQCIIIAQKILISRNRGKNGIQGSIKIRQE